MYSLLKDICINDGDDCNMIRSRVQWLCTGCTHGLPTMKNMTRNLDEIKQSNKVRMNAIEKKLDQVCETIEARIRKRLMRKCHGFLPKWDPELR